MRRVAILVLLLSSVSCATKTNAPQLTPAAIQQYNLKNLVDAIGTLQVAAENAVSQNILTQASGVVIVQFCVNANQVLAQVPNGWYATLSNLYNDAKGQLTPAELVKFQPYLNTFELVFNAFKS